MLIKGKLSKFDLFLLEDAFSEDYDIKAKVGASHLTGTETIKIHSEGWGDWYMFGGYCMNWALVQAKNWTDAYYIYLEEFVPEDTMPDDEEELECGTWDGNGQWYSESTLAYVTHLEPHHYDEWEIEITPAKEQVKA